LIYDKEENKGFEIYASIFILKEIGVTNNVSNEGGTTEDCDNCLTKDTYRHKNNPYNKRDMSASNSKDTKETENFYGSNDNITEKNIFETDNDASLGILKIEGENNIHITIGAHNDRGTKSKYGNKNI